MQVTPPDAPAADLLAALRQHFRADMLSGVLVFLIALPLSLAISKASGFPPVAGVLTAGIGGVVVALLGGSALTIKGPAAGLIVVAAGAVAELGQGDALLGYKLTLATIVVAGVLQMLFGLLHLGVLGSLFPSAVMQGMMAAIGLSVVLRQLLVLTGGVPTIGPARRLLTALPGALAHPNVGALVIGLVSLGLLFGLPPLRLPGLRRIPGQLLVLLVAVPLGRWFHLAPAQLLNPTDGALPDFRMPLPATLTDALAAPDFAQLFTGASLKYIVMFALIGSLELLLNTRAVELLDPYQRRSDLNRELLAAGLGNVLAGALGGLPMISEIVRSSANVAAGARTHWSGFFHGLLLLLFVALAAPLLTHIPLAALAAMLIHVGVRLASPREFRHMLRIGGEQLLIFLVTVGVSLSTDLLMGVGAGVLVKLGVHVLRGLPLRSVLRARTQVLELADGGLLVRVHGAAVFSNYLSLQHQLSALPRGRHAVVDLADTRLVDHTALENLARFSADYAQDGGRMEISGLQRHKPVADYPTAARVREEAVSLASA